MLDWFASFSGLQQVFLLCALIGGVILLLRLILTIAGLDHGDGFEAAHTDSDSGFQLLTVHGVAAFFTMFGLIGLTLHRQLGLGGLVSTLGAVAAGLFSMWLVHAMFQRLLGMQSSGSIDNSQTVGSEGTVYMTVTGNGGRVQVTVANRLREFEAVSSDGASIETGTAIRVERVAANTLVVTPLKR